MDDTELPFSVSIQSFVDFFTCSICMTELTNTVTTHCGHRYCEKCIREWVDRSHKCPCCNKDVTHAQLIRDHQFDCLISTVNTEKEKAEEKYFDTLINTAAETENTGEQQFSPVEKVLKKHLKHNFAAHERYLLNMTEQLKHTYTKLEADTTQAISDLQSHGLSKEEIEQQVEDLNSTLSRHKDSLKEELEKCKQMIADAFDKYLREHIPQLDVLPVKVSISLLDKDIKIRDFVLKPADVAKTRVVAAVEETMKAKHNPVVMWPDDLQIFLFGPFMKCSPCEARQVINGILYNGKTYPDVYLMTDDTRPVLQYSMKPNSELVVYGHVKCESDMPKQCFVNIFKKGEIQKIDYFFCKQCSFKWICRSCMEICHKGHEVIPYIMNHQPEWACCYCPRKKTCVIQGQ